MYRIFLSACVILLPTKTVSPSVVFQLDPIQSRINVLKSSELTPKNVKEYIHLIGIEHPNKVYRQFILETGRGKSYVCRTYNNLFGFRNNDGYMRYKHWTESIESYKRFQLKKYRGGDYYRFLVNVGYAEDSAYICKLKMIKV